MALYGDIGLGQHWLPETIFTYLSTWSRDILLRTVSQYIPQPTIPEIVLKIIFHSILPEANESMPTQHVATNVAGTSYHSTVSLMPIDIHFVWVAII